MKNTSLNFKRAEYTPQTGLVNADSSANSVNKPQNFKGGGERSFIHKLKSIIAVMLLLFFTANWQIVHGQSDLINELENYIGQNLQGRHVLEVNPMGNDGYYISGVNTDNDMLFVARTDPYGNPYWFKTWVTSGTERLAMEVDDRFGTFDVLLSYDNGGDVYALRFDMTGVMAYPNALRIATNAVPSGIRSIRDSGLQYYGFLCSDRTDPYLYLSWIDAAGNVPISNTYEVPWHSKHGNDASFLQVGDGTEDLLFTYGTDINLTAICFFRTQSDGTLMIFPGGTDHIYMHRIFSNINEPSSYDIHDIQEIADPFGVNPRAYVIAGGVSLYGAGSTQLPFSGLFDDVVDIVYANQFSVAYPYEFTHLTRQIERGTNDMLAAAVSYPTPFNDGELHFIQYEFGSTQIINFQMIKAENGSLQGESHFPMSFALNQAVPRDVVFTAYNSATPGTVPFVSLDGGFNITGTGCSLEEPNVGVDELLWQGSFYQPSFFFANATSQNTVTINDEFLTAQYLCNNPCPGAEIEIEYEGCFITNPSITLDAVDNGFAPTDYLWLPDGQTTQDITVTSPGTYTVFAFNSATGCADQATIVIDDVGLAGWQQYSVAQPGGWVEANDVEKDPDGNIYTIGTFSGTVNFMVDAYAGTTTPDIVTGSATHTGMYITKYTQCGVLEWVAYSEVTGNNNNIRGVDIEYRNDELHLLLNYDGTPTGSQLKVVDSQGNDLIPPISTTPFIPGTIDIGVNASGYSLGSIEELPGGEVDVANDIDPINNAGLSIDELTSLEYIGSNYYIAGRENGSAYIAELNHGGGQYSPTGNAINGPGGTHEIINDIEYYDVLGNQKIYVTGKYDNPAGLFGALPGPAGTYDAFVGGMVPGVLANGFLIAGNNVVDSPESGILAEGIEIDYLENSFTGNYDVIISGEYEGDLSNPNWNITVNTGVTNAFVAYLEDVGTLDCQWVFTFDDDPANGLLEARATSVIFDETTNRIYAAGEADADLLLELGGGVSLNMNQGSQNMWVAEIDFPFGGGAWMSEGAGGPNFVRGIAGHENQAFVGGYSPTNMTLDPTPSGWPISSTIPLGGGGGNDMFLARIGDFSGSQGQFFKRDPDDVNKNDENVWSEPESQQWEVNVMPNPSSGDVTVQLQTNSDEPWNIEVYNSIGGLVLNTGYLQAGSTVYQNNWSSLSSGLYLLKITQGSNTITKRLVIR